MLQSCELFRRFNRGHPSLFVELRTELPAVIWAFQSLGREQLDTGVFPTEILKSNVCPPCCSLKFPGSLRPSQVVALLLPAILPTCPLHHPVQGHQAREDVQVGKFSFYLEPEALRKQTLQKNQVSSQALGTRGVT